jgi:hypothetical protein
MDQELLETEGQRSRTFAAVRLIVRAEAYQLSGFLQSRVFRES